MTFAIVSLVFYGCGSFLWNTVFVTTNIPSAEESRKLAEESSQKFHTLLNQGKCQDIINELAGANLKANSSNVIGFCNRISEYGTVVSTKLSDWNVVLSRGNSEKVVQLQYDTKFSKSLIQEEFIWRVKDGKA